MVALVEHAADRAVAGHSGRKAAPGEPRQPRAGLDREQAVELGRLLVGQAAGELARDVALGAEHGRGDDALDDRGPGRQHLPAAQLVQEGGGDPLAAGGGERDRQRPGLHLAPKQGREGGVAERLAQVAELLAPRLAARGVLGEDLRADADLLGDEGDRLVRDHFARARARRPGWRKAQSWRAKPRRLGSPRRPWTSAMSASPIVQWRASSSPVRGSARSEARSSCVRTRRLGMAALSRLE